MELTYKQLLTAKPELVSMLKLSPALSARIGVSVARTLRLIEAALRDFEQAREMLVQQYSVEGKFDEGALKKEERAALDTEFNELLDTTVSVDVHPIQFADIEALEQNRTGFNLPATTFYNAEWLFEGLA